MAYEVGLVVGQNTNEPFTITKVLTKEETTQRWCVEQGKSYPHDKAYEIKLKCGKLYYTLNTQITKCIQRGWGWNKCQGCDGNKSCSMDTPISHTLSVVPNRNVNFKAGEIFGNLKLIDFAFNAKRHNYYEFECIHCGRHYFHMTPTNDNDIQQCNCVFCKTIDNFNSEHNFEIKAVDKNKPIHIPGFKSIYKGEDRIINYLIKNNIPYSTQYYFSDCKHRAPLPFDVAILYPNKSLKCLIEYDGEQHYKFIPYFHGNEEGFELQKLRDNIKNEYCQKHNIKLIRIPYTDFDNIEEILKNNLIV